MARGARVIEQARGALVEHASGLRQRYAADRALEQADVQLPLQLADLIAQGRLRNAHAAGRFVKAAGVGDLTEIL